MTKQKITVGLIFGGKSGEHKVSLQSAKSIYQALDKRKYKVVLIGVDKKGLWYLNDASNYLLHSNNPKLISLNKGKAVIFPVSKKGKVQLNIIGSNQSIAKIDVFFPIIHGTYGEDGCFQGLFEILETAYVGSGVLGSALCMDKVVSKQLLIAAGISVAPHIFFTKKQYKANIYKKWISENLPVFIKPANTGSSVGINKVKKFNELKDAIEEAFEFDNKIIIEKTIEGREIEVSVLGNDNPKASIAGEVISNHEFYSYSAKYIDKNGARLKIPAQVSSSQMKKIQQIAVNAYQALQCVGMGRVDMFLKKDGNLVMNEINTLPGFTNISMYPKLWEASGLSYSQLLDKLILLAMEQHQQKTLLHRRYKINRFATK